MQIIAEVIGISRYNLVERLQERPKKQISRPPRPDDELVAEIKPAIANLPTYGHWWVHAVLKHQVLKTGLKPPDHNQVYRVMNVNIPMLDRHAGDVDWMNAITP